MNEFVEDCRREWRRLGVPDPVADEMAAELDADLAEAEAEGVSAEEVLGSGAGDPRAFATAWAAERGVVQQTPPNGRGLARRAGVIVAIGVFALIAVIGGVLVIVASPSDPTRLAFDADVPPPISPDGRSIAAFSPHRPAGCPHPRPQICGFASTLIEPCEGACVDLTREHASARCPDRRGGRQRLRCRHPRPRLDPAGCRPRRGGAVDDVLVVGRNRPPTRLLVAGSGTPRQGSDLGPCRARRRLDLPADLAHACGVKAFGLLAACTAALLLSQAGSGSVGTGRGTPRQLITAAACRWPVALRPESLLGSTGGRVWEISATSSSNVWAGGHEHVRVGTETTRARPLLARWDGRSWKAERVPLQWGSIDGLVTRSPDEAWATATSRSGTTLLKWNGTAWSRAALPRAAGGAPQIAAGPRGQVWLVGTRVAALHGRNWAEVPIAQPRMGVRVVTSLFSDELWRIHARARPPILERWNGRGWTVTPVDIGGYLELTSLEAFSPRVAWLAATNGERGFLFRWNGRSWRRTAGPPPTAIDSTIQATGRGTVWLSGSLSNPAGTDFPPYLRKWDGQRWVSVKPPTDEDAASFQLYPIGNNAVWATTTFSDDVLRLDCATG